MNEPSGERWISVAEAVRETGVPVRTIYRWIKAKRLPTRTSGGAAVVEIGAVRALPRAALPPGVPLLPAGLSAAAGWQTAIRRPTA